MSISPKTHKMLWGLAASRCAFPDCRRELVMDRSEQNDASLVGEECHMVAREANGPRGISPLSLEERNKYDNLILLCNIHHKLVDDQSDTYSVSLLREMKKAHEKWVRESLQGTLPVWSVPYLRNPLFTGRENLLKDLHDKLTTTRTAALTQPQAISGLGGVGKTQTAIEYAYTYRDAYHAVLWMRAASRNTLISDFVTVANLLSLPEKNEQNQNIIVAAVQRWLATTSNWLLVFDNADDLEMILEFLPYDAKGHILITTCTQVTGHTIRGIEIEKMDREESMLLLLRRAKKLAPDDTLDQATEEVRQEAEAIVQDLDGLPLALDQAGAYIEETQCSLSEYYDLYHTSRKELLKRRGSFSSDHPESVATTWLLSFNRIERLNPACAELLRLCAFFDPDTIPEEIITQNAPNLGPVLAPVVSNTLSFKETIGMLRKFSLVRRNSDTKVLSIHRLVQAVIKDDMEDDAQRQWAERMVRAVNRVFPYSEAATWTQCQRYLPQVYICLNLSTQFLLVLPDAARLFSEAGAYFQSHAQFIMAETLKKHSLTICEQVMGAQHSDTAIGLSNLASLYCEQGKYEQAEPLYQRSLEIIEQTGEAQPHNMAGIFNNLATLYRNQGKYIQAEPLLQRARLLVERVYGLQHPTTVMVLNNLAGVYSDQGQYEQAKQLYQHVALVWEQLYGPQHPEFAQIFNSLANVYHMQGLSAQAETLMRRALAIAEQTWGPQHPHTATCIDSLALVYRDQGKYGESELFYQRALEIRKQIYGLSHPHTAQSLDNLAKLYHYQQRYNEAEPLYLEAFEMRKRVLGLQHSQTAESLNNVATIYAFLEKYEQAETFYQQALTVEKEVRGLDHPNAADVYNNLAMLCYTRGQYEQAEQHTKRALKLREQMLGLQHPSTGQSLNNLALIYSAQGKYDQAEPLYQRSLVIYESLKPVKHRDMLALLQNYASLLRKTNREEQAMELEARIQALQTSNA